MKRAVLVAPRKFKMEEVEKPIPKGDQVLIQVKCCGICGSDIHSYEGKHPFVKPPIVLGHEFAGVIADIGNEVEGFEIGDKVTVEPNLPCGNCYNCRHGKPNICNKLKVIGNIGYNGAFAEYISVPAEKVIKLPEGLSFEQGAFVEPTAVGVHAIRKAGQRVGDKILILGAGPIGLLLLQAAKCAGAARVVITDLFERKLEIARKLGADLIFSPNRGDLAEFIKTWIEEEAIDLIYDCVANERTLNQAIKVARRGTKIIIVGVPTEKICVDLSLVQDGEISLEGSLMYTHDDFLTALELIREGKIEISPLITHRFRFEEIEDAFNLAVASENAGKRLKIMIRFQ